jgi:hypothetical protein
MANTPVITNPNVLRGIIDGLGGRCVPAPTFQFDLPLSQVREIIPKISDSTGLGVRKISETIGEHPTRLGDAQTIARLELYRK